MVLRNCTSDSCGDCNDAEPLHPFMLQWDIEFDMCMTNQIEWYRHSCEAVEGEEGKHVLTERWFDDESCDEGSTQWSSTYDGCMSDCDEPDWVEHQGLHC